MKCIFHWLLLLPLNAADISSADRLTRITDEGAEDAKINVCGFKGECLETKMQKLSNIVWQRYFSPLNSVLATQYKERINSSLTDLSKALTKKIIFKSHEVPEEDLEVLDYSEEYGCKQDGWKSSHHSPINFRNKQDIAKPALKSRNLPRHRSRKIQIAPLPSIPEEAQLVEMHSDLEIESTYCTLDAMPSPSATSAPSRDDGQRNDRYDSSYMSNHVRKLLLEEEIYTKKAHQIRHFSRICILTGELLIAGTICISALGVSESINCYSANLATVILGTLSGLFVLAGSCLQNMAAQYLYDRIEVHIKLRAEHRVINQLVDPRSGKVSSHTGITQQPEKN